MNVLRRTCEVTRRLVAALRKDTVTDTSAQLSYYFLFALFPFLFFLATLMAYLPLEDAVEEMLARLAEFMPAAAFELIAGHLTRLIEQPRPNLLTLGLLTTLWTASRGVDAFRKALNLAYDVSETRALWRTQGMAIALTVGSAVLLLASFAGIVIGGRWTLELAARHIVGGEQIALVWSVLRWPVAALAMMLAAGLNYYLLPDVKQRVRFIVPGAAVGTLLWLAATWGFTRYVEGFGTFNITYGSIGGVIVLLLWLYVSGLIFIIGGELNAVIEQLSPRGKAAGARAPGALPEPPSTRPSVAPPALAKRASFAKRVGRRIRRLRLGSTR